MLLILLKVLTAFYCEEQNLLINYHLSTRVIQIYVGKATYFNVIWDTNAYIQSLNQMLLQVYTMPQPVYKEVIRH